MCYRLILTKPQGKENDNLLIKVIERGKITNSGAKFINVNPYLLRFLKKRFNRVTV